ncbi:sugar phosphate nucleotidyltransferase [Halorubrum sp. ASP1]|uniref:sugar phosphate nucleotidyltransferase n=1 Tax=Halorubrum sp. ASP1 TaxID=2518114 RepID=UPI0037428A55
MVKLTQDVLKPDRRSVDISVDRNNGLRWSVCPSSGMDAVISAAGRGSRLGELTADRPKRLVDVAGRPLLAHAFGTASREQTS